MYNFKCIGLFSEARNHTAFLIVYFFTDNLTKMGEDIEKVKHNDMILHMIILKKTIMVTAFQYHIKKQNT